MTWMSGPCRRMVRSSQETAACTSSCSPQADRASTVNTVSRIQQYR